MIGHVLLIIIMISGVITFDFSIVQKATAIGAWNGQDVYHVPMSWCVLKGSPAEEAPNVPPDMDTDSILWRRHERPTDAIYDNQAGITFRSAINDISVLNFPPITDPDTTDPDFRPGDVLNPTVNNQEFNDILDLCRQKWDTDLGRAGIGVDAINIDLLHFADSYDDNGWYYFGWGGCYENASGLCSSPYEGWIMVIDNHYLYPLVPNRSLPDGVTLVPSDRHEWLVGHELGHALSLPHRTDSTALMNPSIQDNNGDGESDNFNLNSAEITSVRSSASIVSGVEIDPPSQIEKGNIVQTIKVDEFEKEKIEPYLDLGNVRVALDVNSDVLFIGQELKGMIPINKTLDSEYWTFIDVDSNSRTGANDTQLRNIGAPQTEFKGADLIIKNELKDSNLVGTVWKVINNEIVVIPESPRFELLTNVAYGDQISANRTGEIKETKIPLNNLISTEIDNKLIGIELDRTFPLQSIITSQHGEYISDKFFDKFKLEFPIFPHCYPHDNAIAGEKVKVDIDNLIPNSPIHGLLGPIAVFNGNTDSTGGGTIDFPIPNNATKGIHLITIGVDGTAFTADCVVNVVQDRDNKQNMTKQNNSIF